MLYYYYIDNPKAKNTICHYEETSESSGEVQ